MIPSAALAAAAAQPLPADAALVFQRERLTCVGKARLSYPKFPGGKLGISLRLTLVDSFGEMWYHTQ